MLRRLILSSLAIGTFVLGAASPPLVAQTYDGLATPTAHFAETNWDQQTTALAPGACDECVVPIENACCEANCGPGCCRGGLFFDGWLAQGFTTNVDHPASNFNFPLGFNDRSDDYQMNQLNLSFGKALSDDWCCWDYGFRTDVMYGSDYFYVQSRGLELNRDGTQRWNGSGPRNNGSAALYGLALPQLYAEASLPFLQGVRAKFGHFYAPMGYESAAAPENFFYSHSYAFLYGEPRTFTGFTLETRVTDRLSVMAGMTNGWDNFENINGSHGFLFGITWTGNCETLSFTLHNGSEEPTGDLNRFMYSLVYTRQLGCRWNYAFQHDFGTEKDIFITQTGLTDATYYGINQYLYYSWTESLDVGVRAEWFRDKDNSRVLQIPVSTLIEGPGNYYNITLGANWRPCEHVVVRPEARYDLSDRETIFTNGAFNDFNDDRMWTFAFDMIWYF